MQYVQYQSLQWAARPGETPECIGCMKSPAVSDHSGAWRLTENQHRSRTGPSALAAVLLPPGVETRINKSPPGRAHRTLQCLPLETPMQTGFCVIGQDSLERVTARHSLTLHYCHPLPHGSVAFCRNVLQYAESSMTHFDHYICIMLHILGVLRIILRLNPS